VVLDETDMAEWRHTFRGDTEQEWDALNAICAVFGSQVDTDYNDSPEPDEYKLDGADFVDSFVARKVSDTSH